jgi:aromatic-L-amino-acid decarboxylase
VTPEAFRAAGYQLIDWITDYVETIEDRPVTPDVRPGEITGLLPDHAPVHPERFADVLADVDRIVVPGLAHWQHPNFFAYFPANSSYPAILGELLSAGLGVNGFSWVTSPACTELELRVVDWMAELLGLPARFRNTSATGGGVIQGTASEATLVAVLSARWRSTAGAVNHDGDTSRLVAYATTQTHSSIEKALRIAGIGTDAIRIVENDAAFAMRPEALAAAIAADRAAGLRPFFVCATRGTTSSMAFDPTPEIAPICHDAGAWLHVDAAMAGIAALDPEQRWVNDGLELADSYCTNPHKWMGINFDCDLYWTADRVALLGALSILPEYLRSAAAASGTAADLRDWQVPLGRRFRSLKLWFGLRLDGIEHYRAMIRHHLGLARELEAWAAADDRFELAAPPRLNLVCVRLADDREGGQPAADAATERLIEAANATRRVWFTRTVLDGRPVLRFSIGSRVTQRHHVAAAWRLLQGLAGSTVPTPP